MKFAVVVFAVVFAAVFALGTPLPVQTPDVDHHWDSKRAVLPMNFAHDDHLGKNCITCHHNYVDDTGGDPCMYCHVTDERVAHLLESQFHELCMGCHVDKALAGEPHGPVRRCISCHLGDDKP